MLVGGVVVEIALPAGTRASIRLKADDVAELVDEPRIIGKLELPNAVRLELWARQIR